MANLPTTRTPPNRTSSPPDRRAKSGGICTFCGQVIEYKSDDFVTYATKKDAHLKCHEINTAQ